MSKDNELVTKGAVKKAIRKEMGETWGLMCGSHELKRRDLIRAITVLPAVKERGKDEQEDTGD